MLISPTEPAVFRDLGNTSSLPEKYGCDFLIQGKRGRLGVQRKKFPSDLLSSLADGRLYSQIHMMADLTERVVILEGYGRWNADGTLMDIAHFTRTQLNGLIFSLSFEFDVQVLQVRDVGEMKRVLGDLERWWKKPSHMSLRSRPGPRKDSWGRLGNKEYGMHLLMSFPGVGPELAGRIYDHFGGVPIEWGVTMEELMKVPGVGKGKAEKMWNGLQRVVADESED